LRGITYFACIEEVDADGHQRDGREHRDDIERVQQLAPEARLHLWGFGTGLASEKKWYIDGCGKCYGSESTAFDEVACTYRNGGENLLRLHVVRLKHRPKSG